MKIAILDANPTKVPPDESGIVAASYVANWMAWEAERAGVVLVAPGDADVVLLVFAGAVDWYQSCKKALKRHGIEPDPYQRRRRPYVVAGGPVDSVPLTALKLADGVLIGEGIRFVRWLFREATQPYDVYSWIKEDKHAIELEQIAGLVGERDRPWLLANPPPSPLASPDPYITWDFPPIQASDGVVRIIGSKGCHFKCAYCATTYRQKYQKNPNDSETIKLLEQLSTAGERLQIVSNDPANIPWYNKATIKLDSGSYTVEEFLKPDNRAAILQHRPSIARFGVEGLSQRIRFAWGKPIPDDELFGLLTDLNNHKINAHIFMIVGAPYETQEDWEAFGKLYQRLSIVKDYGITRWKFTAYAPTAPAPMMRFVTGAEYYARYDAWNKHRWKHYPCTNMSQIGPRMPKTTVQDLIDQLQVDAGTAERFALGGGTTDLAPTVEDFSRMVSNALVAWPLSNSQRWKVGETYKERMRGGFQLPGVATLRRIVRGIGG